jgi:two-component system, response regulator
MVTEKAGYLQSLVVFVGETLNLCVYMSGSFNILLIEDNLEHLRLTKYILERNNVSGEVFVARDGQEAIDFLYQRNQFKDAALSPRPDLVLLDLNIPRVGGKEVLRIIKSDQLLQDIPVIVVSSSEREEDMKYAYESGAAGYISKSDSFEKLNEALASIHNVVSKGKQEHL